MFFCRRLATRREDISLLCFQHHLAWLFTSSKSGATVMNFSVCLFVCLFFFFKKDVFRLVKSVGQDKYLQILRSDALQFRGIILW